MNRRSVPIDADPFEIRPKNIISVSPLKANSLATLVLDCECDQKGSESHGFLEGETVFRP